VHNELGARCVDFGGWEMPVQYQGIVAEHLSVRSGAGVFDISHMGEIMVSGAHAVDFLDVALTNRASSLKIGEAQYSLMCNSQGGVIDDLYVYRVAQEAFLTIVNASRIENDLSHLNSLIEELEESLDVNVIDESAKFSAIALQGPCAVRFIDSLFETKGLIQVDKPSQLRKNQVDVFLFNENNVYVACTGYTGEHGFELVAPNEVVVDLWGRLAELGEGYNLTPAGLGARDTLRMEMGYPLYGNELDETVTPLEVGLKYFVKLDKPFHGRDRLVSMNGNGIKKRNLAFKMSAKSPPPRGGYSVFVKDEQVGIVTSGTQSPSLGIGIGMAFIDVPHANIGTNIEVEIRGRRFPAELTKKPIYKKR
jgi:aminomethyltransferase